MRQRLSPQCPGTSSFYGVTFNKIQAPYRALRISEAVYIRWQWQAELSAALAVTPARWQQEAVLNSWSPDCPSGPHLPASHLPASHRPHSLGFWRVLFPFHVVSLLDIPYSSFGHAGDKMLGLRTDVIKIQGFCICWGF